MPLGRLAHYDLLERLGQGGMGVVFRARDARLGRIVALKVLPAAIGADPERRARFLREARAEAAISHPNIAAFYELGEVEAVGAAILGEIQGGFPPRHGAVVYMALEYVPGHDLDQRLRRGPLPLRDVLDYGAQMAEGLDAAHRAGVIHRDIKPGNIRVTPEGRVKLLDFGLAKILRNDPSWAGRPVTLRTSPGMILGTAQYMAPEQVRGQPVDERTDLFALGILLYQMAAGETPFRGVNFAQVLKAITTQEPEPLCQRNPALPRDLDRVVGCLLAKDPAQRYPSARAVALDLQAIARGESVGVNSAATGEAARSPHPTNIPWWRRLFSRGG